jgi:3-oxoadipate CoA-transferase beta subunit
MACVCRIYTDLAVIDITSDGLVVQEMAEGWTLPELEKITGVPLSAA